MQDLASEFSKFSGGDTSYRVAAAHQSLMLRRDAPTNYSASLKKVKIARAGNRDARIVQC